MEFKIQLSVILFYILSVVVNIEYTSRFYYSWNVWKLLILYLCFFWQAGKLAGLTEDQINTCLKNMKDDKIKKRLKQYTDEALNYGVGCLIHGFILMFIVRILYMLLRSMVVKKTKHSACSWYNFSYPAGVQTQNIQFCTQATYSLNQFCCPLKFSIVLLWL